MINLPPVQDRQGPARQQQWLAPSPLSHHSHTEDSSSTRESLAWDRRPLAAAPLLIGCTVSETQLSTISSREPPLPVLGSGGQLCLHLVFVPTGFSSPFLSDSPPHGTILSACVKAVTTLDSLLHPQQLVGLPAQAGVQNVLRAVVCTHLSQSCTGTACNDRDLTRFCLVPLAWGWEMSTGYPGARVTGWGCGGTAQPTQGRACSSCSQCGF